MTAFVAVVSGVVGLVIGSFLNVVIARVPDRKSVVRPRSHCPSCGSPIAARDLIPVVSFVALRGKCRACGTSIGARYPIVEIASAVLFVVAALRFGASWDLPAFCVFLGALLAVSVIDLDHFLIPNLVVYPTLGICAALLLLDAGVNGDWSALKRAAICGAAGFVFLLLIHLVQPQGMGFGDVRLAGVIGMMLGWLGVREVVYGMFAAFVLASVIGIGLIVTRKRGRKDAVPFGPFLAAGAALVVIFGPVLLHPAGR